MSDDLIEVPFRDYDNIRAYAEDFLSRYHPQRLIPVPIERIVELGMGIDIIPVHGLKDAIDSDGYISNHFQSIAMDLRIYKEYDNRRRFTIAHEIGHMVMHKQILEKFEFESIEEWKGFVTSIDPKQYSHLEVQANKFAGLVLVPSGQLHEMYVKAEAMVLDSGFTRVEMPDMFNGFACRWLAQKFSVAERTVEIRLKLEGIIKDEI
ncbi:ImmA/IrrE family metallo-endopeptidase [Gemmatimonadota bacterium]